MQLLKTLLGEQHPSVATSLNNLARLYYDTQWFDEAEALMEQALEMRQRLLGNEHPDTIKSRKSLETIRAAKGQG